MKIFHGSIEEDVLSLLFVEGVIAPKEIIEKVRKKRGRVTKQGVYRVLRKLKQEEKIVHYKATVSLNTVWLKKLRLLLEGMQKKPALLGNMSYLHQDEKVSLKIKGLNNMDQLWSHIFQTIEESIPKRYPLYLFNSHNWSILLRKEIDKLHIEFLQRKQRSVFLTIGNRTWLDQQTIELMNTENVSCTVNTHITKPFALAVIGNYVIQVKLLEQGDYVIHKIFQQSKTLLEAQKALERIDHQIVSRITIENDSSKAVAVVWKKRLSRNFLIPIKQKDF